MDDFRRFKIIRKLGSGGMGDVFQAYDPSLDTKVALKVFKKNDDSDLSENLYKRFVKEAQILAKINHPYIVRIFEVGSEDQNSYISMEFVQGITLTNYIYKKDQSSDEEKKRIVSEVLVALAEIHKAGIIHRDIKPDNIMVDSEGHIKLMDFGIVKSSDNTITQTNLIIGTPSYMSPEQIEAYKEIDGRSDLFSFASVIYELFTQERAFRANSQTGVIKKVMMDSYREFSKLPSHYGSDFNYFLEKAFEKKPENRFANAEEMLLEWEKVDLREGVRVNSFVSWTFFTFALILFLSGANAFRLKLRREHRKSLSPLGQTKLHYKNIKDKRKNILDGNTKAVFDVDISKIKKTGEIGGWAIDFDKPSVSVNLFIYADGKQIAQLKTNSFHRDLNDGADVVGEHGFLYVIPEKYRQSKIGIKVEDVNTYELFNDGYCRNNGWRKCEM